METRLTKSKKRRVNLGRQKVASTLPGNAKVKVQYIQNHKVVDKLHIAKHDTYRRQPAHKHDDAENVEYLDESTSEDFQSQSQSLVPTMVIDKAKKEPLDDKSALLEVSPQKEDPFYPNAIHCLISLYRVKYKELRDRNGQHIDSASVWEEITRQMNECYFDFKCDQIKMKFYNLRQEYFRASSNDDINSFEYFDQLHEIYQDKFTNAIITGNAKANEKEPIRIYPDEELFQETAKNPQQLVPKIITVQKVRDLQNQEEEKKSIEMVACGIAAKEHQVLDIVERQLQAMERSESEDVPAEQSFFQDSAPVVGGSHVGNAPVCVKCRVERVYDTSSAPNEKQGQPKTMLLNVGTTKSSQPAHQTISSRPQKFQQSVESELIAPDPKGQVNLSLLNRTKDYPSAEDVDMSVAKLNEEQDRRHREMLDLLSHSIHLQEQLLETHRQMMETLLKRT